MRPVGAQIRLRRPVIVAVDGQHGRHTALGATTPLAGVSIHDDDEHSRPAIGVPKHPRRVTGVVTPLRGDSGMIDAIAVSPRLSNTPLDIGGGAPPPTVLGGFWDEGPGAGRGGGDDSPGEGLFIASTDTTPRGAWSWA